MPRGGRAVSTTVGTRETWNISQPTRWRLRVQGSCRLEFQVASVAKPIFRVVKEDALPVERQGVFVCALNTTVAVAHCIFKSKDSTNFSAVGGSTSTQNLLPAGSGLGTSACVCQLSVVSSSAFALTDPFASSVPTQKRTAFGLPPVITTSNAPSPPPAALTGASIVATSFRLPTVFSPSGRRLCGAAADAAG